MRRRWGCGCSHGTPWHPWSGGESFAGRGRVFRRDKFISDDKAAPEDRTCPQWFVSSPFYLSLLEIFEDYKVGRLGNVRRSISQKTLQALRIREMEFNRWEAYWDSRVY